METSRKQEVFQQVYELVSQVPSGKVSTYGDIAKIVRVNPRYIGFVLHNNPFPGRVPCHRVVNASGQAASGFAFGGPGAQQKLLEDEGILFTNGKLDLCNYRYQF